MENKELLNPEPEDNKKEQGVENLNSEKNESTPQSDSPREEEANESPTAGEDVSKPQDEPEEIVAEQEKEQLADAGVSDSVKAPAEEEKASEPARDETEAQAEEKVEETEEKEANEEKEEHTEAIVAKEETLVEEEKKVEKVEKNVVSEETEEKVATKEEKAVKDDKKEKAAKDDKKDKAEEDEGDHDLNEKYGSLAKAELVEAVEALVQHEDINFIRKHIGYIKVAFRNHLKQENLTDYEKNIQADDENVEKEDLPEVMDEHVVRFDKAFSVYKQKKTVYDQALERQKQDNLKEKEAILEELRQLIESEEELKKTYDVFKELQDKWREIGPVPQSANNTLWNNYHFLVEKFFDKVKINKELRDLDLKKNLEIKTELCEKAEELLLETSVNKSFQKLQKLHEAWKEIGPVPKDKKDEIWERFKTASDSLNERRQGYYEGLREEQNKNYGAKIVLCEKAEQLAEVITESPKEWQVATDQINELFKVWKTIGFAPKKVNDDVWVRFRTALDNFFRNKKNFFQKYKDEQSENYNQKLNLCMQAEALKDSEDWKHTTDELIALQQQWKKLGPVPRKFSDKIWKRFRAACDEFFNRKAAYFSNIGEKHDENLRKKKDLIELIKSYEYSKDNTENLNSLKDFQRQWMEIGHVPIKEKDGIQNEFRKTINEQFDKLNISRKVKSTMGFKNKIENLKNTPNADNIIYKERSFILSKISTLQNDIKLWENNIGFFASSKKADVLKQEFENKIERARSEIQVLEEKMKILRESQN